MYTTVIHFRSCRRCCRRTDLVELGKIDCISVRAIALVGKKEKRKKDEKRQSHWWDSSSRSPKMNGVSPPENPSLLRRWATMCRLTSRISIQIAGHGPRRQVRPESRSSRGVVRWSCLRCCHHRGLRKSSSF